MSNSIALDQYRGDRPTDTASETTKCNISDPENSAPAHEHGQDEPATEKTQALTPPDGGFSAWLVVVGAWCASFCGFGWVNSITRPTSQVLIRDH